MQVVHTRIGELHGNRDISNRLSEQIAKSTQEIGQRSSQIDQLINKENESGEIINNLIDKLKDILTFGIKVYEELKKRLGKKMY